MEIAIEWEGNGRLHTLRQHWKSRNSVILIILAIDFDKIVKSRRRSDASGLSNMGASIRDAGAVTLAVASGVNKIRDAFLKTADYHLKVESINDTTVMYGVKPFTNVHGIEFALTWATPR